MPRPSTREGAVTQYGADIADTGTGLHEWLEAVRTASSGIPAAAFVADTKGPLVEGEEVRARQWGRTLADLVGVGSLSP